jgi:hypothetical protein
MMEKRKKMKQHNEIIHDELYRKSASQVIGASYTRTDTLRQLVYNTYGNSSIENANSLNIFIDLSSVIHALYSEHNRIIIENITDISSAIINMCGHYRSFFKYNLGVATRIFLINSTNCCDINIKFIKEYNEVFKHKVETAESKRVIDANMRLLKTLCPYLPQIYYIESGAHYETAVIMAYLIEELKDPNPNLIISHDMYPLQLCAQYKWTSYLYPRKSRINNITEDTSWMVPINDKPNFRYEFWRQYANFRKMSPMTIERLMNISPINYPLFIALCPFPERNLKAVLGAPQARHFIEKIVGKEDIKIQSSQFLNDTDFNSYPVATIDARYKAMDVQYMLPFYKGSPESSILIPSLLDLKDNGEINNICARYYADNPIDLQKL